MKSIRTDPRNHAAEGDERIRTAAQWLGTVLAYVDRSMHALHIPHRYWWRLCDAYDLSLGVPDTPANFPRRHGWVRLQHVWTGAAGYPMGTTQCHHCGRVMDDPGPCVLVPATSPRRDV